MRCVATQFFLKALVLLSLSLPAFAGSNFGPVAMGSFYTTLPTLNPNATMSLGFLANSYLTGITKGPSATWGTPPIVGTILR